MKVEYRIRFISDKKQWDVSPFDIVYVCINQNNKTVPVKATYIKEDMMPFKLIYEDKVHTIIAIKTLWWSNKCPNCKGRGYVYDRDIHGSYEVSCSACKGQGTENGEAMNYE